MKRTLADTWAFGKQYLRSPMWAFFSFIFPILLVLLFGALFTSTGTSSITLTVQDLDGTNTSHELVSILNGTHVVHVVLLPPTTDLAGYVRDHSLSVALQIPAGFQQRAAEKMPVNVTLFGDPTASAYATVDGVARAAVVQLNYALNQAQPVVGLATTTIASPRYSFMDYFVPGIIGMTVMTSAMYSMTSVTANYRSRRYFTLLATTPLGKGRWLLSKIVFYSLLLAGSLFLTVAIGAALFPVHISIGGVALALILAGTVMFTSLGMLIGVVTKDPEGAIAIANAIGFPMMFLSGTFWDLSSMPGYLQTVAQVLPLTYLSEGLRDSMVYGNWSGAYLDLAIASVAGIVLFVLASRLVSWKET